jgi:hypothetical protein
MPYQCKKELSNNEIVNSSILVILPGKSLLSGSFYSVNIITIINKGYIVKG